MQSKNVRYLASALITYVLLAGLSAGIRYGPVATASNPQRDAPLQATVTAHATATHTGHETATAHATATHSGHETATPDPSSTPAGHETTTEHPAPTHEPSPTGTSHDSHTSTATPGGTMLPIRTLAPTLVFTPAPTPTVPHAGEVPLYSVYQQSFGYASDALANPWRDAALHVMLERPDGSTLSIDGFFYRPGEWRFRFAPDRLGVWHWTATLRAGLAANGSILSSSSGSFTAVPSSEPGPLRIGPVNPARLVYANGRSFPAIGIGDCVNDGDNSGTPHDNNWGFDGGFRIGHEAGSSTDLATYARAYGHLGAGFTLFRWSVDNCSFKLWDTIAPGANRYLVREGRWGDEMVDAMRANGIRIYMTIFGFNPPFGAGGTSEQMASVREYVDYVVARYGAKVDVWELMNEATASDAWIGDVAAMLRSADPYGHPISTSWERPDDPAIQIVSPHWYEREDELRSDEATRARIQPMLRPGKPVIFGEQGNSVQNWDERSAIRMRLRSWSALFNGGTLIFWNSSYAKDNRGGAANLYIGPEERSFVRILQAIARPLDARDGPFAPTAAVNEGVVRAYGLQGPGGVSVYLVHADNHERAVQATVTLDLGFRGDMVWIDPATGRRWDMGDVDPGRRVYTSPPFAIDIALAARPRAVGRLCYLPWAVRQ